MSQKFYLDWRARFEAQPGLRAAAAVIGVYSLLAYYLVGVYMLFSAAGRRTFFVGALALGLAWVFILMLNKLFPVSRPYQKFGFVPAATAVWLFSRAHNKPNSFPSEHVASLAAVSFILAWYYPGLGVAALLVAAFIGLARVLLGYHYVVDVIGGFIIGGLAAFLVYIWLAPLLWQALPQSMYLVK